MALTRKKWKPLDDAFRSGNPERIIAALKRVPWQDAPLLSHPLWDLLGNAHRLRAEDSVAVFDVLLEMGMDPKALPSLAAAQLGHYSLARRVDRARLSAPTGNLMMYGAGMWTRALAFAGRPHHRNAWIRRLSDLNLPPENQDWCQAISVGRVDLLQRWSARGHACPPGDSLVEGSVSSSLTIDVYAAVQALDQLGWSPSADLRQHVVERDCAAWLEVMLTGWRPVFDDWSPEQKAGALRVLWRKPTSVSLVEGLMEDPLWRDAAQLCVGPLDELKNTPLANTPLPAWALLLHPRSVEPAQTQKAWHVVQDKLKLGEGFLEGWTPAELWAMEGRRAAAAAEWGMSLAPNPATGRWPAAGAARGIEDWVVRGGGMKAALSDPRGPLAEWMERAGQHNPASSGLCPFEALALESLKQAAPQVLSARWKGVLVEMWAGSTPPLRQAWAEKTGAPPRTRQHRAEAAWVAARGRALPPLEKRVAALSSEEAAQLVVLAQSYPSWVNEMRRIESPEDTQCFERLALLHEAGVPLPSSEEAWLGWEGLLERWSSSELSYGLPAIGEAARPVWPWWERLKKWPVCLAPAWATAVVHQAGRLMTTNGGSSDAMSETEVGFLIERMRQGLAGAAAPRAAWEQLCWSALGPTGPVATDVRVGKALYRGLVAVAEPGWLEDFAFDVLLDAWEDHVLASADLPLPESSWVRPMPDWLSTRCMETRLKKSLPLKDAGQPERPRFRM